MTKPTLYVGTYNYSSWSMRGWLALRFASVAFDEVYVELDADGYGKSKVAEIVGVSPSGKVPALRVGDTTIWDSLAIGEWAAEQPGATLWPSDPLKRAVLRSATCEMHSGFSNVRRQLPMNMHTRQKAQGLDAETLDEIARIDALWCELRKRFDKDGPYLGGQRSLADAFFAPVASRFRSYAITLSSVAAAYRDTLLADPDFKVWEERGKASKRFTRGNVNDLYPAA